MLNELKNFLSGNKLPSGLKKKIFEFLDDFSNSLECIKIVNWVKSQLWEGPDGGEKERIDGRVIGREREKGGGKGVVVLVGGM